MYLRKLIMTTVLSMSVLGASVVSADSSPGAVNIALIKQIHQKQVFKGLLTDEQRDELKAIKKNLHEQLLPLFKEKMALKLQLKGKMASPQTQWADISKLVDQLNENNAKITTLIARTQLSAFQKLGVLLPLQHHYHHHVFKGWR
jgi:protein CpxP